MSTPSLPQQLLRDLRRNPKKAGMLALLAGVALWFWAPLVASWFKSGDAGSTETEHSAAVVAAPVSTSPVETKAVEPSKAAEAAAQTWQQLVRWMDQDPRRKADAWPLERDPFAPHSPPPSRPKPDSAKTAKSTTDDPEKIALKLTGTLLGPGKRLALINGRAYAEGQTVKVASDMTFVVRQIEAKRVSLERQGKVLVLQAIKPRESDPSVVSRVER